MRIVVEASQDHGIEIPRTFRLKVNRIEVVEVLDQWYGPDYRYCKVKGRDGALYIFRLDENRSEWQLTLFASARAQGLLVSATMWKAAEDPMRVDLIGRL